LAPLMLSAADLALIRRKSLRKRLTHPALYLSQRC
jgi:hypothetical protein